MVHFKSLFANTCHTLHAGHLTTQNTHSFYMLFGKDTSPRNLGTLLASNIVTDKIMSAKKRQ
jgi:hypothetical protein